MRWTAIALAALAFHLSTMSASSAAPVASSLRFCSDWRFAKGEHEGAEVVDFDDTQWTAVRLPHDWAIAGPFDPQADGFAAKLPWKGVGWYRKHFALDRPDGTQVYLDFDGVMAFPKVYVNGQLAGTWDYGYTSFRVDATPFINLHGNNVVAVRVDTTHHGTRWYSGAGIYRKVMLELRGPVHVAHWGVYVTTPHVADAAANVKVELTVENHDAAAAPGDVAFVVLDPDGNEVSRGTAAGSLQPGETHFTQTLVIPKPRRWDVDSPQLYALRTAVRTADKVADECTTPFGVRTIEFTADDGFHLNGRRVQLYGVNLHHDQGPLGAAFNVRAMQRQLEIMKEMGVNALRTSHNAPAPEVLDLCDRMGIVVWDECFDKWNATADRVNDQPSHEEHAERHLHSLMLRDRNHPSVVVWSIGNEIPADRDGVNPARVKMMADVVRKYDSTRPVGMGCCVPEQARTTILDGLDLSGWNYGRRYSTYREHYPHRPIVYAESASALSTRGFYELPLPTSKTDFSRQQHQVNSYDFNAAPWSDIADAEFRLMAKDRFVAGEFVWTGFDYLGEPTPFEKQAKSSYFGIVDLVGIPKDRYWLYRSHWRPEATTVHILPHWNWPDRLGLPVPVFVYTNGDSAELFLNGRSLGRRTKGERPERPTNLAAQRPITASSVQPNNLSELAADGDPSTRWSAADGGHDPWLQADLGENHPIKCLVLDFPREAKNYGYVIKTYDDLREWRTVVTQPVSEEPRFGGPTTAVHDIDDRARYVRVEFEQLRNRAPASVCELGVYTDHTEASYYDPIYDYRLRWNNVEYEPGELKANAYRDGQKIGSAVMRTAGPPATIRLTPDRTRVAASGDDLSYVLVEAVDKDGVLCPLADILIRFQIEGPGEIAGVANGNPLSLEPFQAAEVKLFYGKAMLILRAREGESGVIQIAAASDGADAGEATIRVLNVSQPRAKAL